MSLRNQPLDRLTRFCGAITITVLLTGNPSPAAAASASESELKARVLIVIFTVVGSLVAGILLYHYSQRSAHVKFKDAKDDAAAESEGQPDPKSLVPAILQELEQVTTSPQQREHIARSVSEIVTKTVDERVSTVKRELNDRYGQIIEEKRRAEAVLQKKYQETLTEKKQTSAVLESIAEGLVVVNNKGEVVMMNPAAEKLLAVEQTDRLGKPLLENLRDEELISLVRSPKDEDREIVLNAKQDSTKRILRASNAVITDEDGKAVGMVAVLSDVTKQRELDQLKSDFISTVSHELRTPLVAMRHALSILVDQVAGPVPDEQKRFLEIVQRNLDRLNILINDLLDLSKLEAKKMQLRLETGPIDPVIHNTCESLEIWAKSKGITIQKRVPEGLPQVVFDPSRISQVLTNLIGNAIKFTPKQGRVIVEAKRRADEEVIEVTVQDTGIGIAKEDLPKLFNKFQQVGERMASDIGGTGLGLAIAKEIIDLHRGRIWAESEAKQGARFIFTVPTAPPLPVAR